MQSINIPLVPGEHPLDTASRLVGGRGTLAKQLGVSVAAIGNWKTRGVRAEKCPSIERLTNGLVRCEVLCPDVDWDYIRNSANHGAIGDSVDSDTSLRTGTARRHTPRREHDLQDDVGRRENILAPVGDSSIQGAANV